MDLQQNLNTPALYKINDVFRQKYLFCCVYLLDLRQGMNKILAEIL